MRRVTCRGLLLVLSVVCACSSGPRSSQPPRTARAPGRTTAVATGAASSPSTSLEAQPRATREVEGFPCDAPEVPETPDDDPWLDTSPPHPSPMCEAKPNRVEDAERAVMCAPPPARAATTRAPAWDHATPPAHLTEVAKRYALSGAELARLLREGLLVPERLGWDDYTSAFEDVHRSQLPVYVSADAVLHAVYVSHDKVLAELEADVLSGLTRQAIERMHEALREHPARYAKTTAEDLDLYLTVALRLLADGGEPPAPPVVAAASRVAGLVELAQRAPGLVQTDLFGRVRFVDFGAFRPRGHYAPEAAERNPGRADLSRWFRGAMWLSRLELNLVSRSSRSSSPTLDTRATPREVALALALANLAKETAELETLERVDRAWAVFAGAREDVPLRALVDLAERTGIASPDDPDATTKLMRGIGEGFRRTARTHYQVEGTSDLPVIATLLGPRIPPDLGATRDLVHGAVQDRREIPAVEMAWLLGQDRARAHLTNDLARFPTLLGAMEQARDGIRRATKDLATSHDLYTPWLAAVAGLAAKPEGAVPSFHATEAFADMRVASAVAGYAQLRHNHVLLVPMTMDEGGCEIPDGWVDPVPAVYDALLVYADRGAQALESFGKGAAEPFRSLGRTLRVIRRIALRELAGEPLRDEERRFLAMIVQEPRYQRMGYGPSTPIERGWYFDLFRAREDAREPARLVADHFGSVHTGRVDYAGVSGVVTGLFVIDTGGAPRVVVGPVTRAFQAKGSFSPRWSDDDVPRIPKAEPWAATYLAKAVTSPRFTVTTQSAPDGDRVVYEVASESDLGEVTLGLLDHHNVEVASETQLVRGAPGRPAKVVFRLQAPPLADDVRDFGVEGLRVSTRGATFFDTSAGYGLGLIGTSWTTVGTRLVREDVYAGSGRRRAGPARRL